MRIWFLLAATCVLGSAQSSFDAVLERRLLPDRNGVLVVSRQAVEFRPHGKGQILRWTAADIQRLRRTGPTRLELLSFEDSSWKLDRDRLYRFELLSGEISAEMLGPLEQDLATTATDRIPAKHLHPLGGCRGVLVVGDDGIEWRTDDLEHATLWRFGDPLQSIWSADPYQLELRVREPGGRNRIDAYRFQLAQPLHARIYRQLKLRLLQLDSK